MKEFTGMEYLQIDIANNFGLDYLTWDERITWTKDNTNKLFDYIEDAKKQFLYYKGVIAYQDALKNKEIGHITYLDATASGIQIMAAISGCMLSAKATNLINTGKPQSAYTLMGNAINKIIPDSNKLEKNGIKKQLMTHFYCKQCVEGLDNIQTKVFYTLVDSLFPGPTMLMHLGTQAWRSNVDINIWTLPDNHTAYVPITEVVNTKIEIDELNHCSFAYRYEKRQCTDWWGSLVPNIIHSIEAYILREVTRKCSMNGIPLAVIHDNFGSHPNFMNYIRKFYNNIMAEISDSRIFQNILAEIGFKIDIEFPSLAADIKEADYALN